MVAEDAQLITLLRIPLHISSHIPLLRSVRLFCTNL